MVGCEFAQLGIATSGYFTRIIQIVNIREAVANTLDKPVEKHYGKDRRPPENSINGSVIGLVPVFWFVWVIHGVMGVSKLVMFKSLGRGKIPVGR